MKKLKNRLNDLFWFFYKLTPKGKQAFMFKQALQGMKASKIEENKTKFSAIGTASKLLKPKKILTFHKGKSIAKSKKSSHQVIETVKHQHQDELNERGLKITNKGTFKHA